MSIWNKLFGTKEAGTFTPNPPSASQFVLGNCDFSPAKYRTWTLQHVRSTIGLDFDETPGGYYTVAGECATLFSLNDDKYGFFNLAFLLKDGVLQEITASPDKRTAFLCLAEDCKESLLKQLGFENFKEITNPQF